MTITSKNEFGRALRTARGRMGLSQEEFGKVSGRTYISQVEREERHPTLAKIDELASVLEVHPAALVACSYLGEGNSLEALDNLLLLIRIQAQTLIGRPASQPDPN